MNLRDWPIVSEAASSMINKTYTLGLIENRIIVFWKIGKRKKTSSLCEKTIYCLISVKVPLLTSPVSLDSNIQMYVPVGISLPS